MLPRGITSIAIDKNEIKWFVTWNGIARYNDTTVTEYTSANSGPPGIFVGKIAIDHSGNKWIMENGLVKFDGQNWTVYDSSNSGIKDSRIEVITPDELGNIWIGSVGKILKFDGKTWTEFNTSTPGLPAKFNVLSITVDIYNNKWIGTDTGLLVFREEGVILTSLQPERTIIPGSFYLSQNYPNPFNPATKITFSIPESRYVKLAVYDILGKEVTILVNDYRPAGSYTVQFNASDLPSGIYLYRIQAGEFSDSKKLILIK